MTEPQRPPNEAENETATLPEGQGESGGRRRGLEAEGGQPLTKPLEDGQLRGTDEEGSVTNGTHGGPKKPGGTGG